MDLLDDRKSRRGRACPVSIGEIVVGLRLAELSCTPPASIDTRRRCQLSHAHTEGDSKGSAWKRRRTVRSEARLRDDAAARRRGSRAHTVSSDPLRRVWVDLTNSPHVLVLAPIIRRLRAAGHDVLVTARDFAQTIELAERHGLGAVELGRHGGMGGAGRARAARVTLARGVPVRARSLLRRRGRARLERAARSPRAPSASPRSTCSTTSGRCCSTRSAAASRAGCWCQTRSRRASQALRARRATSWCATPGSRRSTTSPTSYPTRCARRAGRRRLAARRGDSHAARARALPPGERRPVRPPSSIASARPRVHAVVLPRTREQGLRLRPLGLPSLIVPDSAVDAPSLLAGADLVVSAGAR